MPIYSFQDTLELVLPGLPPLSLGVKALEIYSCYTMHCFNLLGKQA